MAMGRWSWVLVADDDDTEAGIEVNAGGGPEGK